jgi:NADH-quinone oxidoreductase subunit J
MISFAAIALLQDGWSIVLPIVLGLIAVYLLLPRPRPFPSLWGATAGGLSLLLAGRLLIERRLVLPEMLLFYAFSTVAVVAGGLLVTQRNPVRAALSFALVVLSTCGLFLLQAAPFLMAATIIIYAGAIIVTFIFVIMLAQQEGLSSADDRSREPFLSCVAGFVVLGALLAVLHSTYLTRDVDAFLQQVASASQASSRTEIQTILGDRGDLEENLQRALTGMHPSPQENEALNSALREVESRWEPGADVGKLKEGLRNLHRQGLEVRNNHGSLQAPADLPLSNFSRPPVATPGSEPGRRALPAENVAYLGRTLFTDYLVAVELGGTLLLVATIGAIAIAGRRPEEAR